ncbi:MAG: LPXTG cell wall anchor domain-containing protein [Eubacteriales bacterium]|nr:LPXTG cell wall anchor domain-containing protein [Eubacteriales bacterium]
MTTTATTEEPPSSDTAASDSTVSTDSTAASDSTASTDSTAVSESTLQVPADLTVNFTVSDSVNIYSDETTSDTVTLKYQPGEGDNSAVIQVPCYADLSNLTVSFTDAYDGSPITAIPEEAQDFSNGNTVEFTLSSISADTSVPAEYTLKFSVVPEEHVWHEADCTNPQYCENCGATQGSALGHSYSAATCTEPEICSRCGATGKAALGHDWKAATCTTPETCRRCGEMVGEPLGHNWQAATCTVPKTCKRCGATEGNALGHDMRDDWRVVNNSTATTHGQENRTCHRDGCSYTESRPLNIIGDPSGNGISGIAEGQNYNLKTVLTFTAYGAGMSNTEPINGDVRYVPSTWSIQNTPGTFRDNFTGSFSISMSGRYTLTVTYQKQIYSDGWQVSDIADSKSVSFTVGNVIQANPVDGTANGIKINPQTGDSTPIIAFVIALAAAALVLAGVLIYKKKRK